MKSGTPDLDLKVLDRLREDAATWAFELLCKGLEHPDARVRLAAIAATGFPAWPEFLAPLVRLQETDPDPRVARRAAHLAALIREAHPPGNLTPSTPP